MGHNGDANQQINYELDKRNSNYVSQVAKLTDISG
jgi:hypothetical protein